MKKIVGWALIACTSLLVAGCAAAEPAPAMTNTVTATATVTATPTTLDSIFLKHVREDSSITLASDVADADLIELASTACESLEDGMSSKDLLKVVADSDFTQSKKIDAAKIMGYGIGVYCPELRD